MKYEEPKMEVIVFSTYDIMVASDNIPEGGFEDM